MLCDRLSRGFNLEWVFLSQIACFCQWNLVKLGIVPELTPRGVHFEINSIGDGKCRQISRLTRKRALPSMRVWQLAPYPREVNSFGDTEQVAERGNESMDRDRMGTFYRRNVPEADSMKTEGRIEDLVRMFKVLPSTTQREYSIVVDGREYGPSDIDNFAREFGIEGK